MILISNSNLDFFKKIYNNVYGQNKTKKQPC